MCSSMTKYHIHILICMIEEHPWADLPLIMTQLPDIGPFVVPDYRISAFSPFLHVLVLFLQVLNKTQHKSVHIISGDNQDVTKMYESEFSYSIQSLYACAAALS